MQQPEFSREVVAVLVAAIIGSVIDPEAVFPEARPPTSSTVRRILCSCSGGRGASSQSSAPLRLSRTRARTPWIVGSTRKRSTQRFARCSSRRWSIRCGSPRLAGRRTRAVPREGAGQLGRGSRPSLAGCLLMLSPPRWELEQHGNLSTRRSASSPLSGCLLNTTTHSRAGSHDPARVNRQGSSHLLC